MSDTPITGNIDREHARLFTPSDPAPMTAWMQAYVKQRAAEVKGADFILTADKCCSTPRNENNHPMTEHILPMTCPICGKPPEVTIGERASNGEWCKLPMIRCAPCDVLRTGDSDAQALARWNSFASMRQPQAIHTSGFSGTVTSSPDWQALHQQQLDRNAVLTSLLERCLPIVQSDADMASSISRHAPLDPESQARHDSTPTASELLLPDIATYLRATPAAYSQKIKDMAEENNFLDHMSNAHLTQLLDACALIMKCQDAIAEHMPPDSGISDESLILTLTGLLDGPEARAIMSPPLMDSMNIRHELEDALKLLMHANSVLRSMHAIVDREVDRPVSTYLTNWPAFRAVLEKALKEQHEFLKPHYDAHPGLEVAMTLGTDHPAVANKAPGVVPELAGSTAITCPQCQQQLHPSEVLAGGDPGRPWHVCMQRTKRDEPPLAAEDAWLLLSLAVDHVKSAASDIERGSEQIAHAAKVKNRALAEASGCLKLLYRDKPDSIVVTVNEVLDRIEAAKRL